MEFMRQPELAEKLIRSLYSTKKITLWMQEAMVAGKLKVMDLKVVTNIYISLFQGRLFWPQVIERQPVPKGEELKVRVHTIVSAFLNGMER